MITVPNTSQTAKHLIDALVTNRDKTIVFDLDGVLLDASHRIKLKPDGSLDLEHYRSNTTPEQVAQDKSLPLLEVVHALNELKIKYHVATARVLCENTINLLTDRQILPALAMGRAGDTDHRRDYLLKADHFKEKFSEGERAGLVLIDDCLANCQAAEQLGMLAINVERCTLA